MIILSGDEFLCLQEYYKIKSKIDKLSCPKLIISRSSKDIIPEENENVVFIMSEYTKKESHKVFEYIKPYEIDKLKKYIGKYEKFCNLVPISEFKDLKNSQYTVLAYNLMMFNSSVVPFIKRNIDYIEYENITQNVFDFVDKFLSLDFYYILENYEDAFTNKEESFWWVLDNTVQVCLNILSGNIKGIHPYRVQKCTPVAKKLGYRKLFMIKQLINHTIDASRLGLNFYDQLRPLAEFEALLYNNTIE